MAVNVGRYTKKYINKISVTETRMIRIAGRVTIKDKIRNKHIRGSFGVRVYHLTPAN